MAKFCARVRKHEDLPSVSMKDIYRHPTIRSLATTFAAPAAGAGEAAARAARDRPGTLTLSGLPPRPRLRPPAPGSTRQYGRVRDPAAAVLPRVRLGVPRWAGARAYEWVSAARGYEQIYLRSVLLGGAGFIALCTVPIAVKWMAGRPVEAAADPGLEPGLRPVLDRQDAGPVEPAGLPDHRIAAVQLVPAGPGGQGPGGAR